jgi:hypothetical protein
MTMAPRFAFDPAFQPCRRAAGSLVFLFITRNLADARTWVQEATLQVVEVVEVQVLTVWHFGSQRCKANA